MNFVGTGRRLAQGDVGDAGAALVATILSLF